MTISPFKSNHLLAIPDTLKGGNFKLLAQFPGYFKWQDTNVIFRINGVNLQHIINHWPNANWIGGSSSHRDQYLESLGIAREAAKLKKSGDILGDDSDYHYHRAPLAHQRKAFLLSRDRESFALLMEQGTGKTKVILDNACYLHQQGKIDMLVVVAWPNGVHRNWVENELPEDMSVPYAAEFWTSNWRTKKRQKDYDQFLRSKDLKVFTFNVEAFVADGGREFLLRLLRGWRCMFVIDQSASIKNPRAKRTKFLIDKASQLAPYRRVLDGDPCAEGADELYSQFKFLDPNIIGHDTWTGFQAEFCELNFFGGVKGYKNLPILQEKIDGYCFRVLASECQDLPPKVYKRFNFDLSGEEQRIYDELKVMEITKFDKDAPDIPEGFEDDNDFRTYPGVMEEHNALVKNLRLQQISAGWWPVDDFRSIEKGLPSRCKALLRLLEEHPGEKALIFSRFRPDLEMLQRVLGKKSVGYHGGVSEADRARNKKRFMTSPDVLYFLGQPKTAGIGHTLTEAKHVIFYTNDPSLRLRKECEKRAHRQGLKHSLLIWDLTARKSCDGKVVRALRSKKELSDVILQDPESFFLQYDDEE